MIVLMGQGGVAGGEFEREADSGELLEQGFKCPRCGKEAAYLPRSEDPCADFEAQVKWDRALAEAPTVPWEALFKSVRLQAMCCGHRFRDLPTNRRRLGMSCATIRHDRPGVPGVVTYTSNALAMHQVPWARLVREYILARRAEMAGDATLLRTFVMKRLARFWQERLQSVELSVTDSDYSLRDYWPADGEKPNRWDMAVVRFLTIDVQRDHYWVLAQDWRANGDSRVVYCGRIESIELVRQLQERLGIANQDVGIDSGYETDRIARYRWRYREPVRQNGREVGHACWVCLRGDQGEGYPHVEQRGRAEVRINRLYSVPLPQRSSEGLHYSIVKFSNLRSKDVTAGLVGGAKSWGVPRDAGDAYHAQMRSEAKVEVAPGKFQWKKTRSKAPNHLWDCSVMQVVLAAMRGILQADE